MKKILKSYGFILCMLLAIVAGCIVGAVWPQVKDAGGEVIDKGATVLEPLGTVFINLMFCVVVPMVFCSIASAIANMPNLRRAGKVLGTTVVTFLCTAGIAAVIMYIIVRFLPIVTVTPAYEEGATGTLGVADMIVNFFTKPDFTELWSRKAILPLIVAAILFGFGIQMSGGGGVPAQRIGILVGAPLLQQQVDSAVFVSCKKDVRSAVQVAVLVHQAAGFGPSGARSVLV